MSEQPPVDKPPLPSVPPDGYRRAAIALHRFFEATWQEGGEYRARIEAVLARADQAEVSAGSRRQETSK